MHAVVVAAQLADALRAPPSASFLDSGKVSNLFPGAPTEIDPATAALSESMSRQLSPFASSSRSAAPREEDPWGLGAVTAQPPPETVLYEHVPQRSRNAESTPPPRAPAPVELPSSTLASAVASDMDSPA